MTEKAQLSEQLQAIGLERADVVVGVIEFDDKFSIEVFNTAVEYQEWVNENIADKGSSVRRAFRRSVVVPVRPRKSEPKRISEEAYRRVEDRPSLFGPSKRAVLADRVVTILLAGGLAVMILASLLKHYR